MLGVFFSSASRKAWVSGVIAALLTPLLELLRANGQITWRTALIAVITGVVSAVAVYATTNTPPGPVTSVDVQEAKAEEQAVPPFPYSDPPGEHEAPE